MPEQPLAPQPPVPSQPANRPPNAVQLKASSPRWTALGVITGLIGVPAGFVVLVSMLQIDNADTLGPMSALQDIIAVTALVVGLLGICGGSIYLALRLGRRPSAAIATTGVVVYNLRSLLVPWQMISGMTTFRRRSGRTVPALLLADGEMLPLLFASTSAYWTAPGDGSSNVRTSLEEKILEALREHRPELVVGSGAGTANLPAEPGSLRQHRLPGTPVHEMSPRPMPIGWRMLPFYLAILAAAEMKTSQGGQPFRATEFAFGVGAVFAVGCVIVAVHWARWSRSIAVGIDWIAWKPRWDANGWRVIPVSHLVSIAPAIDWARWRTPRHTTRDSVALRRSDGRGIRLGPDDLAAGAAAAILPLVSDHPGMTAQARSVLARYKEPAAPADAGPARPVS
jgi:hypothetical protein